MADLWSDLAPGPDPSAELKLTSLASEIGRLRHGRAEVALRCLAPMRCSPRSRSVRCGPLEAEAARRPPRTPTPAQRLADADALVRAGCFDCLLAALPASTTRCATFPRSPGRGDLGRRPHRGAPRAARARARHRATADTCQRARGTAGRRPACRRRLRRCSTSSTCCPGRGGARSAAPTTELELERSRRFGEPRRRGRDVAARRARKTTCWPRMSGSRSTAPTWDARQSRRRAARAGRRVRATRR